MATLKEFEDALREQGNTAALEILAKLRNRDKEQRTVRPARRITGKKMTPELAREILQLNQTTQMTQQEIAFQLGVNQGRVNEVIKRGKWLDGDPEAPEAQARDRAVERAKEGKGITPAPSPRPRKSASRKASAPKAESLQPEPPQSEPPGLEAQQPEALAAEPQPEMLAAEPQSEIPAAEPQSEIPAAEPQSEIPAAEPPKAKSETSPPESAVPEAAIPAAPSEPSPDATSPKSKAAKPAKPRKQGPEQFRLL